MKIAITTKDGKNVDQHFGIAESFYIYELSGGELKTIEVRDVNPYCENEKGLPVNQDHEFALDKISKIFYTINDCKILYTQKIGVKPFNHLTELGIKVQECNCLVDTIISSNLNCS